ELGVRLLERTSRRVVLTGDGRRLLDEARAALSAVDRVRAVAADLSAGRAAVLRVGTTPGVGSRLTRAAAKLRAATPDLTLSLVPRIGRPVRSLEDAAVEIGMSTHDATVVCGCGGEPAPGVAVRPLAPLVEVPGLLLTPPTTAPACLEGLVAALS